MKWSNSSISNFLFNPLRFRAPWGSISILSLLGLLAKIKVSGVLPAHLPLILDAGTVLVSVPPLSCAGFVCCHCTRRWAVLDNTHGKDSGAFRWGLLYSHYHALTSSKQKYAIPYDPKPNPCGKKLIESYCSLVSHWGDMKVMIYYIDILWILIRQLPNWSLNLSHQIFCVQTLGRLTAL